MATPWYRALVDAAATKRGVDPDIVDAMVRVESSGHTWAHNPEPKYRYFWDVRKRAPFRAVGTVEAALKFPPKDFPTLAGDPDQEWWAQQASWGLMQVMGAVAREYGCVLPYLPELCDPVVGLDYGCRHFAALMRWSKGNVHAALAAYNGGKGGNERPPYRNSAYVDKVLRALATVQV